MELLILLENPEKDLESIKRILDDFDCSLTVEKGKIVITTSSLVGDVDLRDNKAISNLWEEVKNFIDVINGSAVIEGVSINLIVLHYVKYVDADGEIKFLPNIGNIYVVLPGLRSREPDASKFIPLAMKDEAVTKVLRLCGRELDWINLYRIYELVSEDAGGLKSKEFAIFTGSANDSRVTGDHARHGKVKGKAPKKSMRLADAQHLIKSTVREWIYSKLNSECVDD